MMNESAAAVTISRKAPILVVRRTSSERLITVKGKSCYFEKAWVAIRSWGAAMNKLLVTTARVAFFATMAPRCGRFAGSTVYKAR